MPDSNLPVDARPVENRPVIQIDRISGITLVRCRGRLVLGESEEFYDEIRELIPTSKRIVLDLNELTHMDSTGLGTVIRLYVTAKSAGCELQLMNLGKGIRKIFTVANLFSFFTIIGENDIRMS